MLVQPLCPWPVLMSQTLEVPVVSHFWTRPCALSNYLTSPCTGMTSVASSRGTLSSSRWWWLWSTLVRRTDHQPTNEIVGSCFLEYITSHILFLYLDTELLHWKIYSWLTTIQWTSPHKSNWSPPTQLFITIHSYIMLHMTSHHWKASALAHNTKSCFYTKGWAFHKKASKCKYVQSSIN